MSIPTCRLKYNRNCKVYIIQYSVITTYLIIHILLDLSIRQNKVIMIDIIHKVKATGVLFEGLDKR